MRRVAFSIAIAAMFALSPAPAAADPLLLAQAGAVGGTIGKKGKSAAGSEKPAPTRKRATRAAPAGPHFLGCFKDGGNPFGTSGRDLHDKGWRDSEMTIARCVAFCRSQGYAYAGAQFSRQCYCGNEFGKRGRASNCNMPCAGNPSETCGGSWANSVYKVSGR
jgi:hypothetical protein